MAIVTFNDSHINFDGTLEPAEFWPQTTNVVNAIVEILGPKSEILRLEQELIGFFNAAGMSATKGDQIVFALKDLHDKLWYIGFKYGILRIGSEIHSTVSEPITSPKK